MKCKRILKFIFTKKSTRYQHTVSTHQHVKHMFEKRREGKLVVMNGLQVKSRDGTVKTKEEEAD